MKVRRKAADMPGGKKNGLVPVDEFLDALDCLPAGTRALVQTLRKLNPAAADAVPDRIADGVQQINSGRKSDEPESAHLLRTAFSWHGTPEGADYWCDLYERLYKQKPKKQRKARA
jgi:hypothetical protein